MKEPRVIRELSREDSKMLQGLSLLATICFHLFCRPYKGLMTPLVFFGGYPLSLYIGRLSDFSVFGFAFLSGYGHLIDGETPFAYRRRLRHFGSVYLSYCLILLVFSLFGILTGRGGRMPGSLFDMISGLLLFRFSYNGAHWYMLAYLLMVLLSPCLLYAVRRFHPLISLSSGFLLYTASYIIRFSPRFSSSYYFVLSGAVGMALFAYITGAVCCRFKIFSRLFGVLCRLPRFARCLVFVLLPLGLLWGRTRLAPSLFVSPVSGFMLMTLFVFAPKPRIARAVFLFLGRHSTNIWLSHMFFFTVVFPGFVYRAEYPFLVFLLTVGLCAALSCLLTPIEKALIKRFRLL